MKKKIVALLCALCMLIPLFVSCDTPPQPSETSEMVLVENGAPTFRIIIPGTTPKNVLSCGESIAAAINEKFGLSVKVEDDFNAADPWNKEKVQNDEVEILIGATNRVETEQVEALISHESDWAIRVVGKKLVICAGGSDAYVAVAAYFAEHIVAPAGDKLSIPADAVHQNLLYEKNAQWQELLGGCTVQYAANSSQRVTAAAVDLSTYLKKAIGSDVAFEEEKSTDGLVIHLSVDTALDFYDYRIQYEKGSYRLTAGSSAAVDTGVDQFLNHLVNGDVSDGEHLQRFDYSLFNPLCTDPTGFTPSWSDRVTVPEWMTDFEEKLAALFDADGRPLTLSHGRAGYLYPDNSLENALSNMLLGADILEMDVYHTKDNVIVMCHNSTLSGSTNAEDFVKTPGYPSTDKIEDWTFAQLRELSMTMNDGTVTPYKVPSLYEILLLTRSRCFLMIDRKDEWVQPNDIIELALATDSMQSFLYSMFLNAVSGGYTGSSTAMDVMYPYLQKHPEDTEMQKWFDLYMEYYNAAGRTYPKRTWVLESGTGSTYKETETLEDFIATVEKRGSHIILWTNQMDLASTFISSRYQPSPK